MIYQITSDNMQVSTSMQTLAQQKLKKIEHRLTHIPEDSKSVRLVMNSEKDGQFVAKIHLVIKGKEYFAQHKSFTLENALVEAVIVVERELQLDKITNIEGDWEEAREAKRFDPQDPELLEEEINS